MVSFEGPCDKTEARKSGLKPYQGTESPLEELELPLFCSRWRSVSHHSHAPVKYSVVLQPAV